MNNQKLQRINENQWKYQGERSKTLITYKRLGLIYRFTIPNESRHFNTVYDAAQWLSKQERSNQRSNNNARRNV